MLESNFLDFLSKLNLKNDLMESVISGYSTINESVTRELMYLYQYLKDDDKSDLAFNEPWYIGDFVEQGNFETDDETFNGYMEDHEWSMAVDWLHENESEKFKAFVEFVETFNDEGQEGHTKQYFDNDPEIVKNQWLLHFTDNSYEVFREGFNRGTDDIDKLGLTTYRTSTKDGIYGFAYDAPNTSYRTYAASDYGRMFKYGQEALLFRASGVKVYHYTDNEYQVIFDTRTVHDIVAIEKVDAYIDGYNDTVWGIRNKNGENLFTSKDDSIESFEQTVDWVIANYDRYRKKVDTGKAPSSREPGKNKKRIH